MRIGSFIEKKSDSSKAEGHHQKETEERRNGSFLEKKIGGYEMEGQKKYLPTEHTQ
jgi:hypothetical protein